MSDEFLNRIALIGMVVSVAAAAVSAISAGLSGYANYKLSDGLTEKLKVMNLTIGSTWPALNEQQVETLRLELEDWKFSKRIQILYNNEFGRAFALSLANAFRAAHWEEVNCYLHVGAARGIEVSSGPPAIELTSKLISSTGVKSVNAVRLDSEYWKTTPLSIAIGVNVDR